MCVIGIDPGSRKCGYGIVDAEGRYIASGTIVLSERSPLHVRLVELFDDLSGVMEEFRPEEAVVEKVFVAKSVKSALVLGQARGVALLAASKRGMPIHEYAALEIKKAVTGYGRAEKPQVMEMVKRLLNLQKYDLSPDGADALAMALCHINQQRLAKATGGGAGA